MSKSVMHYYRDDRSGNREEITYDRALDICLGSWRDCDMTRDMLSTANRIHCMYSDIEVVEETENGMRFALMAGLCNMLPSDVEYDENGNRL